MPILGIDNDKCTKCGQCIQDCPRMCFSKNDAKQVVFDSTKNNCFSCGHCIAVCPVNAIKWEHLGEIEQYPNNQDPGKSISYQDFLHFIRSKRSIRRYKKDPVPKDLIDKVFTAMQYAPSGHNDRNWNYMIMSDPVKIKELGMVIAQDIQNHPLWAAVFGEGIKKKIAFGREPIFFNAPVIIILSTTSDTPVEANNAGIALTYGMLAAETLGLGSCWIGIAQIGFQINEELKKKSGIRGKVWGVITLGYPDVKYFRTVPRKPLKIKEGK